jgi:hypothetical protein
MADANSVRFSVGGLDCVLAAYRENLGMEISMITTITLPEGWKIEPTAEGGL